MRGIRMAGVLLSLLLCGRAPAAAQGGPCAGTPDELARAVLVTQPPTALVPVQQPLFTEVVNALRADDKFTARRQLVALVRANPGAARQAGLCNLIHVATRLGTLGRSPQLDAALRRGLAAAEAAASDTSAAAKQKLQAAQQDYQRATSTIANIQKQMYDDAMKVLQNLKS